MRFKKLSMYMSLSFYFLCMFVLTTNCEALFIFSFVLLNSWIYMYNIAFEIAVRFIVLLVAIIIESVTKSHPHCYTF